MPWSRSRVSTAAGASSFVEREARIAEVRHHRMALGLDDPRAEDPFVEPGELVRVVGLEGDVIDPCHPALGL